MEKTGVGAKQEYEWQSFAGSLKERKKVTDKRREELLNLICNDVTDKDDKVIAEWVALVVERDSILRKSIDKENRQAREHYVRSLRKVLKETPLELFELDKETDRNLRSLLSQLRTQVQQYCSEQGISQALVLNPASSTLLSAHNSTNNTSYNLRRRRPQLRSSRLCLRASNVSSQTPPLRQKRKLAVSNHADNVQTVLEKKYQTLAPSPALESSSSSFTISTPQPASSSQYRVAPDPGLMISESLSDISWAGTPISETVIDSTSGDDTRPGSTAV